MSHIRWKKYLYLSHRYSGIITSFFIFLWCLSGIIMMYVAFPKLTETQRLEKLPDIRQLPPSLSLPAESPAVIRALTLEYIDQQLVFQSGAGTPGDAHTGLPLKTISDHQARAIARSFSTAAIRSIDLIERDQWTVYSRFHRHRPLYKVRFSDPQHSEIHISSTTGQVVQYSTRWQRGWSWPGAVSHWLYPTVLRQHGKLWYWLVIALTLIALLSVVSGLWLGIRQLRRRPGKPLSPYRGLRWLHHWGGVGLSLLLFSFLLSGLLSMNPWGLLETPPSPRVEKLQPYADRNAINNSLQALAAQPLPAFKQLRLAPRFGEVNWIITSADGQQQRLDSNGRPIPGDRRHLRRLAQTLAGDAGYQLSLLHDADDYYYGHKTTRPFPVWRLILNDESQSRFYFSATTAEQQLYLDHNGRSYRWLFHALHQWDLSVLRQRPLWDILLNSVLLLLTLFAISALIMAKQRLQR